MPGSPRVRGTVSHRESFRSTDRSSISSSKNNKGPQQGDPSYQQGVTSYQSVQQTGHVYLQIYSRYQPEDFFKKSSWKPVEIWLSPVQSVSCMKWDHFGCHRMKCKNCWLVDMVGPVRTWISQWNFSTFLGQVCKPLTNREQLVYQHYPPGN